MPFKRVFKYQLLGLLLTLAACSNPEHEQAIARVGDSYLYPSDIAEALPKSTDAQDSALLADEFINKWIKKELIIQKANENLSDSQKDVSRELEEYRNSLIIYRYKNELLKQRLDTVVSASQIEQFYTDNATTFKLDRCIVKAVFVKLPNDIGDPEHLKQLVADDSEEGQNELYDYCMQYAKSFEIALDKWIDFQVLNRNLPLSIEDPETFLTRNRMKEMNDSNYYYLVRIHDYVLTNELAPLEFVENNIKNLILNQRKVEFLKALENNIFTEGERQKKFKIYNRKTNE